MVALFIAVAIPIPAITASGLSLPLPGFVARAAFVLVPGADWLLFVPAVAAGAIFLVVVLRRGGASAYVTGAIAAMVAAFVGVYVFTPYGFAWHLGTSSSRVVLPIGLFAAAFVPLLLHHALDPRDVARSGISVPGLGRLRRNE